MEREKERYLHDFDLGEQLDTLRNMRSQLATYNSQNIARFNKFAENQKNSFAAASRGRSSLQNYRCKSTEKQTPMAMQQSKIKSLSPNRFYTSSKQAHVHKLMNPVPIKNELSVNFEAKVLRQIKNIF